MEYGWKWIEQFLFALGNWRIVNCFRSGNPFVALIENLILSLLVEEKYVDAGMSCSNALACIYSEMKILNFEVDFFFLIELIYVLFYHCRNILFDGLVSIGLLGIIATCRPIISRRKSGCECICRTTTGRWSLFNNISNATIVSDARCSAESQTKNRIR